MAIGAITQQATLQALGVITINKRLAGDPVSLRKGSTAFFNYNQGGGIYQRPLGDWVKAPISGSTQMGFQVTDNLQTHSCNVTFPFTKRKGPLTPPDKKGIIIVKNPDAIVGHPSSQPGTIPSDVSSGNVGDFVKFYYDPASQRAKPDITVHTCTHTQ